MILDSRNNSFDFRFPRTFVPEAIAKKYEPYLNRIPGNLFENAIDFINYGIQGINLPGITFDPVSQADNDGTTRYFRGKIPIQNTIERQFTVTMQLMDGYINYWIMTDLLLYYYAPTTKQKYIDDLNLGITDAEDLVMTTIAFEKPIMNQISELSINMSDNVAEFSTFDVNFYYNKFNIKIQPD
tara:strand:+ start:1041 stop:1592 length:552 start_codon:yes stop_codon:yes gene_type:complete